MPSCEREDCGAGFEPREYPGGEPQRFCSMYCKDRAWLDANRQEVQRRNTARKRLKRASQAGIDPVKNRARTAVGEAIRRGELVKGPCEGANKCRGRVEAHHDDYTKPLEVRWLCERHHGLEHRRDNGKSARAA